MSENEEIKRTTHFPPESTIAIDLPDEMFNQGVRAYFSNFSVPRGVMLITDDGTELRGIANVDFIKPEGEVVDLGIYIRVYTSKDEENKNIYALKVKGNKPHWEPLEEKSFNVNGSYLTAKIQLGDPPIAVG